MKCQTLSMPLTFEDIINERCKNTVWITPKLPSVFICQRFKQCCWSAATTEASSNYFTEILSIAEHKTAWASPVCLVKIRNGPIWSSLIRFLPAETAIIFLSLGFSCGPVVLQCPHTQSAAHLERGDGLHVWHIFLQLLYERMVERSKEEQHSMRSPKYSPVKKFIQNMRTSLIVIFDLANAKTDLPSVCFNHLLKGDKSRGEACWDQRTHGENVMKNTTKNIFGVLLSKPLVLAQVF